MIVFYNVNIFIFFINTFSFLTGKTALIIFQLWFNEINLSNQTENSQNLSRKAISKD